MSRVRGYQDRPNGRMGYVKVGRQQRTKLFPKDTPPEIIAIWRAEQRLALKKKRAESGSLAADVGAYLRLRSSMPSFKDREREIKAWLPGLGARPRNTIEHTEIAAQLNAWANERDDRNRPKYSPITINHRRTALGHLYRTLGGRACYNPVRDVPRLPEPDEVDRAIPMDVVRQITAQMTVNAVTFGVKKASLSAIRAEILALTGMRVGELQNLVATDIRLDGASPVVSIRTLKGGKNRRVPLNADAVVAFRAFRKANAFGKFSVSSLRKSLHAACARVMDENGRPIPPIHPHVLRHSFASWLVNEGGVSLKTAQRILGHRNIKTTARYVREDEERARMALKRLESIG